MGKGENVGYRHFLLPRGILNYIPNDNILDQLELKAFADDKSNVVQIMLYNLYRIENIVEKGENVFESLLL